ncbi:MAG: hypothetical protein R3B13_17110 [Polyangiaceae bacterium]
MRKTLALLSATLALGCSVETEFVDDGSVCAQARHVLYECGVSLSLLEQESCAGPSRAAAECVVEQADSCESLALLELDTCVSNAITN